MQVSYLFSNSGTAGSELSVETDLTGGFYNDGEIGPVKITFNIALTTTMLAWSMLEYPEFWQKDVARQNHAINTVIHGMRYINAAYVITPAKDPLTGQTLSSENDILVYQVCAPPCSPWKLSDCDRTNVGYVCASVAQCCTAVGLHTIAPLLPLLSAARLSSSASNHHTHQSAHQSP